MKDKTLVRSLISIQAINLGVIYIIIYIVNKRNIKFINSQRINLDEILEKWRPVECNRNVTWQDIDTLSVTKESIPDLYNPRYSHDFVSPVKNHGSCGSCLFFAFASQINDYLNKNSKIKTHDTSVQHLMRQRQKIYNTSLCQGNDSSN